MNIYVGNISKTSTEETIRKTFEAYGRVGEVKLIRDKYSNELRGFGFVEMPTKSEGLEAIKNLNGSELDGNRLITNEANERKKGNSRNFQGGPSRKW